jgi:hypothetical protein
MVSGARSNTKWIKSDTPAVSPCLTEPAEKRWLGPSQALAATISISIRTSGLISPETICSMNAG